jgi:L-lactate dehydrogenase complex protein LldF
LAAAPRQALAYRFVWKDKKFMQATSDTFKQNATVALADAGLQQAMAKTKPMFVKKRRLAVEALPEFEALRDAAMAIKNHAIAHLDFYLETYAAAVERAGGVVHWCSTAQDAREAVLKICTDAGARTVTKGKSMVTEEIGLNHFLEKNGITPVETDLGEYVIQLRQETPSHIVAPALHLNRQDWEDSFRKAHTDLPAERVFAERRDILSEARGKLREKFLAADVGITGANFLIAETGSSVIVTNEGNGDLTQSLPRVQVVVTGIEKVLPTIEDTLALLRVLARSATGQDISVYTTFSTGKKRAGDPDGPEEYHVVLLDNGRSGMVGTEFQDMLRCIRGAACMNHCPVYGAVGGHAYGATYPGPMGAVLSPMLLGVETAGQLPNASTFCGKCESVCPVKIPLPNLMRHWREREFERHLQPVALRSGIALWAWFAKRPAYYRVATRVATRVAAFGLGLLGRKAGRFRSLPLAGNWTDTRDFPAPEGDTFFALYARSRNRR